MLNVTERGIDAAVCTKASCSLRMQPYKLSFSKAKRRRKENIQSENYNYRWCTPEKKESEKVVQRETKEEYIF